MFCYDMTNCFCKKEKKYITTVLIVDCKEVEWVYFDLTATTFDVVDYIKDKFDVDKAKIIYINEVPIYNQFGVLSCYLKTKNDLHLTIKILTYRD